MREVLVIREVLIIREVWGEGAQLWWSEHGPPGLNGNWETGIAGRVAHRDVFAVEGDHVEAAGGLRVLVQYRD